MRPDPAPPRECHETTRTTRRLSLARRHTVALVCRLAPIAVLALAAGTGAWGCTSSSADLALIVRLVPPSLAREVAAVEVFVLDRCAPSESTASDPASDRIGGQQLLRYGEPFTPRLPALSSPRFAIYVRARDVSCRIVAAGCSDFDLSAASARELVVPATPFTGSGCPARAMCSNGACVADLDAGSLDGGSPDASPEASSDSATDAGAEASLDASTDVVSPRDVTGDACAPLERVCAGMCVRVETDANHCGACGVSCGPMRGCCASVCTNVDGDEMHCGSCGNRCMAGERCCGGRCVNPDAAPFHCGACFVRCAPTQTCAMGMCR